jgi:hypothetical protein
MSEGNETSDVWGRTAGIDEGALSVMAARLESRAKHDGRSTRGVLSLYVGIRDRVRSSNGSAA